MRGALRSEPALLALVVLAAAGYAVFSLELWGDFGVFGFDLGIFDQTVWRYSNLEVPENSIRGVEHIWGDHFSPILILLAPLYWVWDDARMLLLAQAVLLAAAAGPIFLYARGKLGRGPAYLLAGAYLVFWGVQSALNYDFHELAFVPLLLASTLLAAERRRWGLYFAALVALLCVKEDQSVVAVFLGLMLLTRRHYRIGAATVALGVAWYVLVVELLIPGLNPDGEFAYWSYTRFGEGPVSAAAYALTHPFAVVETLFDNPEKRETLAALFLPFLGLMLLSRTAILLVPLIAQRFLSDTPAYWTVEGQYTLAIAAILFVGAADGLARFPRRAPLVLAALVLALNVGVTVTRDRSLEDLARPGFYDAPPWAHAATRALAAVPDDVSVAAQDNLVPRLAHRDLIVEITPMTGRTDYAIASVIDLGSGHQTNGGFAGISRYLGTNLTAFEPVAYFDGWLVLRRDDLPPLERPAALAPLDEAAAAGLRTVATEWSGAYVAVLAGAGAPAFARLQRALVDRLAEPPATVSAGCRQLGEAALGAADFIGDAVAGGDPADVAILAEQDVGGYVFRYVVLCAPA